MVNGHAIHEKMPQIELTETILAWDVSTLSHNFIPAFSSLTQHMLAYLKLGLGLET